MLRCPPSPASRRSPAPTVRPTSTSTPSGLPPMTMDARGAVVRCAVDGPVAEADVVSRLAAKSVTGITPTTGTTFYRIAYRTYREDGVAGVSTARVYLPMIPAVLASPGRRRGPPDGGSGGVVRPHDDAHRSRRPRAPLGRARLRGDRLRLRGARQRRDARLRRQPRHRAFPPRLRARAPERARSRGRSTIACCSSATAKGVARCWRRRASRGAMELEATSWPAWSSRPSTSRG